MFKHIPHPSLPQMRDAARLALQAATAALAVYYLMHLFELPEVYVGILSAVYIMQPSIGGTMGAAVNRVLATFVGSAIGLACLLALPDGFGTPVALASSLLVINAAAVLKPAWQYGVVAAVAVALGSDSDALATAIERATAIGAGAGVGIAAVLLIWPESAAMRFERYLRAALVALARRLDTAIAHAEGDTDASDTEADATYRYRIDDATAAAAAIKLSRRDRQHDRLRLVRRLYHSIIILDRAVATATDDEIDTRDAFRDQIESVRAAGHDIIQRLLDDEPGHDDDLERIDVALARARRIMGDDALAGSPHLVRATLVFGLSEIRKTLQELVACSANAGQRPMTDIARDAIPGGS
jgi:uncharacterized membrane protein YccC